ncbi:hypothetical protein [Dyella sp. RRB7]|uniref:hypothetical protein n=1 Tax=Dyella sp. RRB7 TaxID=2919502 RepID=UPI001FAAD1A2|nr:hypothetical protein [Dyella sp. RRB7]
MKPGSNMPSIAMERLVRALAEVAVDEYLAAERAAREAIAAVKKESPITSRGGEMDRGGHDAGGQRGRAMADAETITMVAALVAGDRWLSADACAVFLGMVTPKGAPNRRGFLERVACRPDFPKQNPITRSWKKSEVDQWAMNQRR